MITGWMRLKNIINNEVINRGRKFYGNDNMSKLWRADIG